MKESRVVVCGATCVAVCGSGCFACIADGPVIITDAATGGVSLTTGLTQRPQD
jgi:hypothetical protein